MVQMIITDLDQTLLHSEKFISDYSISVLEKCQKKGMKIVFATARSKQASARFLAQFQPDIFIGSGGAVVTVGEKTICQFGIPAEIAYPLIQECLHTPTISAVLAVNESVARTNKLSVLQEKDSSHYQYYDFAKNDNSYYLKISVVADCPDAVEQIAAHFPMCDMLRYTGEDLYCFSNRNALKWNAVQVVAQYYALSTDSFIAFGDDKNDLEMIQNCGVGVAVGNAIDEVKVVADFVCDTNDNDGVAKWLEKHVL